MLVFLFIYFSRKLRTFFRLEFQATDRRHTIFSIKFSCEFLFPVVLTRFCDQRNFMSLVTKDCRSLNGIQKWNRLVFSCGKGNVSARFSWWNFSSMTRLTVNLLLGAKSRPLTWSHLSAASLIKQAFRRNCVSRWFFNRFFYYLSLCFWNLECETFLLENLIFNRKRLLDCSNHSTFPPDFFPV